MNWPLNFLLRQRRTGQPADTVLNIGSTAVSIHFVHNRRARRYVIRVNPDGSIRATVPRNGSIREARAFAERHTGWIARQIQRRQEHPVQTRAWQEGTEILYRGARVPLVIGRNHAGDTVQFADQVLPVGKTTNLRPVVERHLWNLARPELTARTLELAAQQRLAVRKVTVRNQRSRWGSCSRRGTISLNWRLILMAEFVRDYIILHELTHLKEMNHSRRFWRLVAEACPNYPEAKAWIHQHKGLLR